MDIFSTITRADFEKFQKENMDPALALVGDGIKKQGLRSQVAARLLGFRAFEAIRFDDKTAVSMLPKMDAQQRDEFFLARRTSLYDDIHSYMRNRLPRYKTNFKLVEEYLNSIGAGECLDIAYHQHPDFQLPKEEDCVHGLSFEAIKEDYLKIGNMAMHRACSLFIPIYRVFRPEIMMDENLIKNLFDHVERIFEPKTSRERCDRLKMLIDIIGETVRESNNIAKMLEMENEPKSEPKTSAPEPSVA